MKKETGAVPGADGSEVNSLVRCVLLPCARSEPSQVVGSAHVKAGWVPVGWAEDARSWWGGKLHGEALWNWL